MLAKVIAIILLLDKKQFLCPPRCMKDYKHFVMETWQNAKGVLLCSTVA